MRDYVCVGCGKKNTYWQRKKPVLCEDCRKAVAEYPKLLEQLKKNDNNVIVIGKEKSYALPYISTKEDYEPEFQDLFHQVVEKLSVYLDWDALTNDKDYKRYFFKGEEYGIGDKYQWDIPISIDKENWKILHDMYILVSKMCKDQYNAGVVSGRSLLMSLNSGDLTLKDFDESLKN